MFWKYRYENKKLHKELLEASANIDALETRIKELEEQAELTARDPVPEIRAELIKLYDNAHARQKPGTQKPSPYMHAISEAIGVVNSVEDNVRILQEQEV